jgi:hypothetical protein
MGEQQVQNALGAAGILQQAWRAARAAASIPEVGGGPGQTRMRCGTPSPAIQAPTASASERDSGRRR